MIDLPTSIGERLVFACQEIAPPNHRLLLLYVLHNPSCCVDDIACACSVLKPLNVMNQLNVEVLQIFGLYCRCTKSGQIENTYLRGANLTYQWRLEKIENIINEAKEKAGQSPQTASPESTPYQLGLKLDAY